METKQKCCTGECYQGRRCPNQKGVFIDMKEFLYTNVGYLQSAAYAGLIVFFAYGLF